MSKTLDVLSNAHAEMLRRRQLSVAEARALPPVTLVLPVKRDILAETEQGRYNRLVHDICRHGRAVGVTIAPPPGIQLPVNRSVDPDAAA